MTKDDARALLPGYGDIQDKLAADYGAKLTNEDAIDFLEYLVTWLTTEDDEEEEDALEDDDEDEGREEFDDDELEDEEAEDVDRA